MQNMHRIDLSDTSGFNGTCPCADPSLCEAVSVTHSKEVFGFLWESRPGDNSTWVDLDFNQVTTLAWNTDPALICIAHQHGVRLVTGTPPFTLEMADNQTALDEFGAKIVASVQNFYLDGVVFDYEGVMVMNDTVGRSQLVKIIEAASSALHAAGPQYQLSVCAPFTPNQDIRYYDYKGMADAADLFYIMFYDTRTAIYEQCIAAPNAALPLARHSIEQYRYLGIPDEKLLLGVPWYGKDYRCADGTAPAAQYCKIENPVPFRGVACSAARSSAEVHYSDYMKFLDVGNTTTGRRWDNATSSPYFNYKGSDGAVHQVWIEDAESLAAKYQFVKDSGIRGTGPFQFCNLDYSTPTARAESQSMWDALKVFTGK